MGTVESDQEWASLATLDAAPRMEALQRRFEGYLSVSEEARVSSFEGMLSAENDLPAEPHEAINLSRLRCWLELSAGEIAILDASWKAARANLPGPVAMRSVAGVQSAVRVLSRAEMETLVEAAPAFRDTLPEEIRLSYGGGAAAPEPTPAVAQDRTPGWMFWRR